MKYALQVMAMLSVKTGFVLAFIINCQKIIKNFPIYDYTDQIIIPGFTDLHVHAPQYAFRGLGMDLELISWLDVHAFTEEAKYNNIEYADKAYSIFTEDLLKSATTRACIFATIHAPATILLMEKLEASGIKSICWKNKYGQEQSCISL